VSDPGANGKVDQSTSVSTTLDVPEASKSTLIIPPSPNKAANRRSLVGGGTTKVLADLQAGVMNARNALENTKAQLRVSQRTNAQLTRQLEDMRDGRERLRLENDGLNNVVSRKERLLQEVQSLRVIS
jgi:chromosome segregation ATPase